MAQIRDFFLGHSLARFLLGCVCCAVYLATTTPSAAQLGPTYRGMCDASAAAPLDADRFIVACDEDNLLRVYARSEGGMPTNAYRLDTFLKPHEEGREADVEGVTRLGNRLWWIASHGRNKDGKKRPTRHRLFATRVAVVDGKAKLATSGQPYTDLLDDLLGDDRLTKYGLAAASKRAPKDFAALNIEGLAATPEGHLLIGFRNPIVDDKALLVPLTNPTEVIAGSRAKLGDPIELDLGGLGVRGLEYHAERKQYVIVAGAHAGGGPFAVCLWSGRAGDKPQFLHDVELGKLHPETLIIYPNDPDRIQLLSDDGTRKVGDVDCKSLKNPRQRGFRSLWVELPD